MRPKPPERLWLESRADPARGWTRPADAAEAVRRIRARRIQAVALGEPATAALLVAQALEQGAFNGTVPRCEVEVRLDPGSERDAVESAVAAARRHWETVPTRPPETPARPGPVAVFLRFLGWHLIGFVVVVGLFEAWSLLVRGQHAAGVDWVVRHIRELHR